MAVKGIKLINGEEIIAEITSERENYIVVETPVGLAIVGEGQMAMVPWAPMAKSKQFSIYKYSVISIYDVKEDLVNNYKRITGGIVTAPAGALNMLEKPF